MNTKTLNNIIDCDDDIISDDEIKLDGGRRNAVREN